MSAASSCVTHYFVLCYTLLLVLRATSVSTTSCYLCDSGGASWENVIPSANRNQKDCLSDNKSVLDKFKTACPADGDWNGCSLDIFYADTVKHSGTVTRVHRSCYPAAKAVGQADGSCLPDMMETGSVWCYCAADGCNYYSSTQSAGVDANGKAAYKPPPGAAGSGAAPGTAGSGAAPGTGGGTSTPAGVPVGSGSAQNGQNGADNAGADLNGSDAGADVQNKAAAGAQLGTSDTATAASRASDINVSQKGLFVTIMSICIFGILLL